MRAFSLAALLDPRIGPVRYAALAWIAALVPSLAWLAVRIASGHAELPQRAPGWAFAGYAIVVAPLLETALVLALAWLFGRVFPRRPGMQVAFVAIAAALLHAPGGGLAQALAVLWPFLVYAITAVAWRTRSTTLAFVVTAIVHALYNAAWLGLGTFYASTT